MRILYIHRTQAKGVEGVHIGGMVNAIKKRGHDLRIIGPVSREPNEVRSTFKTENVFSWFARFAPEILFESAEIVYDFQLRKRLASLASEFKPDAIYERYAFFASAGSDYAARSGIPHLVEVNYTISDSLVRERSRVMSPLARRVERNVFRRAAALAVVSSRLKERALAIGVNPTSVVQMPNAVSQEFLVKAPKVPPAPLPKEFSGRMVVGYIGGFYEWHGLERLVGVLGRLAKDGLGTAVLMVGDGPVMIDVQHQAIERNLPAHFPGTQPHEMLSSWINAMDICVLPHTNDYCSPMKIFEYMACGKPVVAPDLPPSADVIRSEENGILFAPGDEQALAVSLRRLLKDSELRRSLGKRAREIVWEHHTWDKNVARVFGAAGLTL